MTTTPGAAVTEYERLSLALLQNIASGVSALLVRPAMDSPDAARALAAMAEAHRQQLISLSGQVARALAPPDGGGGNGRPHAT